MSSILEKIQARFGALGDINPSEIIDVLIYAMRAIEDRKMTGKEKKEAVLHAMEVIFENNPILLAILPKAVDVIISVDKHEIVINQRLVKRCLPCL